MIAAYITASQAVLPLTVYYDHSCILCRSEIEHIKTRDEKGLLNMVDCSVADFDVTTMPVDQRTMMNSIHAVDAHGRWLKATDVFVVCYRTAGMGVVANTFAFAKPMLERIYPLIASNRHVFSKLGAHKFFNALTQRHLKRKAKVAVAISRRCKDGVCKNSNNTSD